MKLTAHLSKVEKETGVLARLRQIGEKHHHAKSEQLLVSSGFTKRLQEQKLYVTLNCYTESIQTLFTVIMTYDVSINTFNFKQQKGFIYPAVKTN